MPYPNGRPTVSELERDALAAIEQSREDSEKGAAGFAAAEAMRAQALATLVVAARLDEIGEGLPGAGRGT